MPRQPHIGILVAAIYADIKVKILFENYYINEKKYEKKMTINLGRIP